MNDLRGRKVGLFPMCADILHAGHILALQEAKKHCDCLIVALNTHPDGKSPVQTVFERYTQLCAVECVDKVIPYQGKRDLEIIASALNYQVRFLGDDYIGGEWDGKQQELKRGIEPHFISRAHNLSSTDVKKRVIQANDEKLQGFIDVVELAKDFNLPIPEEALKKYEEIIQRKEKILTIVRVRFGARAEKTYDYKYIGETPVRVGDIVIVETKFQGKTEVEVVEVFQIKESEAQFDYAIAEKRRRSEMSGKCRPSLQHKIIENVRKSNLAIMDKKCILAVFELVKKQKVEIEELKQELEIAREYYYRDDKFL